MTLRDEIANELDDRYPYTTHEQYLLRADSILSLLRQRVEGIENPYAFAAGGAIPKYEVQHRCYEEARQAILKLFEG